MDRGTRFMMVTVLIGLAALGHAVVTWPMAAVVVLFGGGVALAFLSEAVVIRLGWLRHHLGPRILGVPIYVLFGWGGLVYLSFRLGLVLVEGPAAALLGATIATTYDVLTDHRGVESGFWTYTDELPGPRFRGVPWWNFAGWFAIVTGVGWMTVPFL